MFIFCGPSGAGKTSLIKMLLEENPKVFSNCTADTTRRIRTGETGGKELNFITTDQFNKNIEDDKYLEWKEVYKGIFYGTPRSELERISNLDKTMTIDLDVFTAIDFKNKVEGAFVIFVDPESVNTCIERLNKRATDSEEMINVRIKIYDAEMEFAKKNLEKIDLWLINSNKNSLRDAFQDLMQFIDSRTAIWKA